MRRNIVSIFDQIILGFWIAFGVTLFEITYIYLIKIVKKFLTIITTVNVV